MGSHLPRLNQRPGSRDARPGYTGKGDAMRQVTRGDIENAHAEGKAARQESYQRQDNPYLHSQLRAAWNRGWDAENHRKAVADAAMHGVTLDDDSTDHHQHSWNLAEALSEIVRGEVEKQVESAVQAWGMDQIETPDPLAHEWVVQLVRSELTKLDRRTGAAIDDLREKDDRLLSRISEAEHTQDQDRDEMGRQIQGLRELVDMQIERAATRIANLQQDLMDTNTHLATANERIADLETTLIPNLQQQLVKIRHAQNQNHGQLEEKVQIVRDLIDTQTDREATRLANIQKRLSEILVPRTETIERLKGLAGEDEDSCDDATDEAIEFAIDEAIYSWASAPPAAGPWKEGPPPDHDMNKWLVTWGEHVFLLEQVDDQFPHIAHHARIHLPETTDD